ncbi:MAG: hypothetical protein KJ597_03835 [Nanoarchaeota archaeon]|nr:hypothetical protein [Nanoarchaeota archaeon]MBU1622677.1 hypothetical protein [Nanoarchaeota archaeon]
MPEQISYGGGGQADYSVFRDGKKHPISIDDLTLIGTHLVSIEHFPDGRSRPVAIEAAQKVAEAYHGDYFQIDTMSAFVYRLGGFLEDGGSPMRVTVYIKKTE